VRTLRLVRRLFELHDLQWPGSAADPTMCVAEAALQCVLQVAGTLRICANGVAL
jgi:hypothetical protein